MPAVHVTDKASAAYKSAEGEIFMPSSMHTGNARPDRARVRPAPWPGMSAVAGATTGDGVQPLG
jgi:hypothetical protein